MLGNRARTIKVRPIRSGDIDNIFWDTINMPENKTQSFSLRVNGAFKAPSIIISEGNIALTSDVFSIM